LKKIFKKKNMLKKMKFGIEVSSTGWSSKKATDSGSAIVDLVLFLLVKGVKTSCCSKCSSQDTRPPLNDLL
jgi:hypothetical protein